MPLPNPFGPFGVGAGTTGDPFRESPGDWNRGGNGAQPYFAPGSEGDLSRRARDIGAEESRRYQQGLGGLTQAFNRTQGILDQGIDTGLLFSRAADASGARARGRVDQLRSSLGARGLNPNSGAASGMLSRLAMAQEGELTGATRDIAIENQKARQLGAAQNFNNAFNLAQYVNSPVSGIEYEASQNIFEGNIAREGLRSQERSADRASKRGLLGSLIGGGLSLLGGLL